jgi:hypothetical protein
MKTFREFILEAEYRAPVNSRQAIPINQANLNSSRPMGPGTKSKPPVKFTLQTIGKLP